MSEEAQIRHETALILEIKKDYSALLPLAPWFDHPTPTGIKKAFIKKFLFFFTDSCPLDRF
jgi:hypothetical protein